MKKKNTRLVLDLILTVALLTLYSKNFLGLQYHEVVGLGVLIPILIYSSANILDLHFM